MLKETGSFRDPSGFIFYEKEGVYRAIHNSYLSTYQFIEAAGLYKTLFNKGLLIQHIEDNTGRYTNSEYPVVLKIEKVPFISYPYKWCFSQLKEAALLTLKIQNFIIDQGLSLKDASAYNVQFAAGKPVFIDTLSFERADANAPWIAYKQFCQHFLVPPFTNEVCRHWSSAFVEKLCRRLALKYRSEVAALPPALQSFDLYPYLSSGKILFKIFK